jgi:hypothetical protein
VFDLVNEEDASHGEHLQQVDEDDGDECRFPDLWC